MTQSLHFRITGWRERAIFPLLGRLLEQLRAEDSIAVIETSEGAHPDWLETLRAFRKAHPRLGIIPHRFSGSFSELRNFVNRTVPHNEWMVLLDADEWIQPGFVSAIRSKLTSDQARAFSIKRIEANQTPAWLTRIMRPSECLWVGTRHSVIKGPAVVMLENPLSTIEHKPENPMDREWIDRYSRRFIREAYEKWDRGIFDEVYRRNPYLFSGLFNEGAVIDIGAHVGCFSGRALDSLAKKVISIEADPANFEHLKYSLDEAYGQRVRLIEGAVWRSDQPVSHLNFNTFNRQDRDTNTGGGRVSQEGIQVECIPLDPLLKECGEVAFLKMDCEGSEYPILYTSKELSRVHRISMEWHINPDYPWNSEFQCDPIPLAAFLEDQGFEVEIRPVDKTIGLLFAAQPGFKFWRTPWEEVTDPEEAKGLILAGYKIGQAFVADNFNGTKTGGKWLDFGCGCGRNFDALLPRSDALHGFDFPNMLSMVPEPFRDQVKLIPAPLSNIAEGYDVIHASLVFQHIQDQELRKTLKHLASRLNPNGRLILRGRGYIDGTGSNVWKIVSEVFRFTTPLDVEDGSENHQNAEAVPIL